MGTKLAHLRSCQLLVVLVKSVLRPVFRDAVLFDLNSPTGLCQTEIATLKMAQSK